MAAHFEEGGLVMWFILATSAFGFAIAFERYRVLSSALNVKKDELLNHVNSFILQGNIEKAIALTSQNRSPISNIVRAGLVAVMNGKSEEEIQTAMDAVALREIPRIERRIPLLSLFSNTATLLGLLGTVSGMILAFKSVATKAMAEKAAFLSAAISEAMNATAFGLLVAIPLLILFGWFSSLAQDVVDDIHEASVSTLNFILANREKIQGAK